MDSPGRGVGRQAGRAPREFQLDGAGDGALFRRRGAQRPNPVPHGFARWRAVDHPFGRFRSRGRSARWTLVQHQRSLWTGRKATGGLPQDAPVRRGRRRWSDLSRVRGGGARDRSGCYRHAGRSDRPLRLLRLAFPELYRAMASKGATLMTVPSAFTLMTGKDHWEVLLRARAIENQCYVLAPAQHGRHSERRVTFGQAMLVDPWGLVVARASDGEGLAIGAIQMDLLADIRRKLPALSHRRL